MKAHRKFALVALISTSILAALAASSSADTKYLFRFKPGSTQAAPAPSGPTLSLAQSGQEISHIGAPVTLSFTPSGGTPPYSWSLSGDPLPSGISFNGSFVGVPSAAGDYAYSSAKVTDTSDPVEEAGSGSFVLSIWNHPTISGPTLVEARVGAGVAGTWTAHNIINSANWGSPTLPASLNFSSTGTNDASLGGSSNQAGSYTFIPSVTDTFDSDTGSFGTVTVNILPALEIASAPITGRVNESVSVTPSKSGDIGQLEWSATGLPSGLTIDTASGLISGSPTVAGTGTAQITAEDLDPNLGDFDSISVSFLIDPALDLVPDAFTVAALANGAKAGLIESSSVTVAGFDGSLPITVTGGAEGAVSVQGGAYAASSTITAGQSFKLRQRASTTGAAITTVNVAVGANPSIAWSVTTAADDTTPDAFTIAALTGQAKSTTVPSAPVTVTGVDVPVTVSVSGGTNSGVSVQGGAYATSATINPGQSFTLRQQTSASGSATTTVNVTVGTLAPASWSVTTLADDTTPDAFTVAAMSGQTAGATIVSTPAVPITGVNVPVAISVSGGTNPGVSVQGGAYSTSATISSGQSFTLRQQASGAALTTTTINVTVGTLGAVPWSVTTADPCAGTPAIGTVCADGSRYAGMTGANKMFLTTVNDGIGRDWTAAQTYCTNLVANGRTDWYLPTYTELRQIYTYNASLGSFPGAESDCHAYWSSTTSSGDYKGSVNFPPFESYCTAPVSLANDEAHYSTSYAARCVRKQ